MGASRGFTYLGVLFVLALLLLTAAMANALWSTEQRRENERELVFAGLQFRDAIERYATHRASRVGASAPASAAAYPRTLEALLRDPRDPGVTRHLRRIYVDPMLGTDAWELVRLPDGAIVGVHSQASGVPLRRTPLAAGLSFPQATSYRDWRFIAPSAVDLLAAPPAGSAPAAGATPATAPGDAGSRRGRESGPPAAPEPRGPSRAPADVAPEQTTAPRVARPSQEDLSSRDPEACARIEAFDRQSCEDFRRRLGEEAGLACEDSALQRAIACSLGREGPLPPLRIRP